MIAFLHGRYVQHFGDQLILDVQGVGYQVFASRRLLQGLPPPGGEMTVYTYLLHREDQMQLYGFPGGEEREMFGLLLGVTGVGPRLALNLLSHLTVADLVTAVLTGSVKPLTRIPGVGEKTAQRLILELKEKMRAWRHLAALPEGLDAADTAVLADAEAALLALGFSESETMEAIRTSLAQLGGKATAEETIRSALMWLSEKR